MEPDQDICYCYHVSLRKLRNYARREHLQKPSQMSQCLGAGTGCGWCIPILQQIYQAARDHRPDHLEQVITPEEYAEKRQNYIREKKPRHRFGSNRDST